MNDGEILCNFKSCRKILSGVAYITRCSHAFCEEDGMREIENHGFDKKCPACRTPLTKNYDLVKVTLNPSDQFRSMVLAGLRPEIVMDVATRSIMFWSYQLHQEHLHQEAVSKNLREAVTQLKSESQVEVSVLKSEIQAFRRKIEGLEKELEEYKLRNQEMSEKLSTKTREAHRWQMTCESLRRKQLESVVLQTDPVPAADMGSVRAARHLGPQTLDDLMGPTRQAPRQGRVPGGATSPRRGAFVFEPRVGYHSGNNFMDASGDGPYRRNH